MGRSSGFRLLAVPLAAGLVAGAAQARGFAPIAPHPMVVHQVVTPMVPIRHPVGPHALDPRNSGLTIATRGRQPGRRFYGGGLGYDGFGSYDGFGYGAAPLPTAAGADLPPPYVIPAPPAPCLPPQIIEIDGGLAHKPKTRVVYGTPACGGP